MIRAIAVTLRIRVVTTSVTASMMITVISRQRVTLDIQKSNDDNKVQGLSEVSQDLAATRRSESQWGFVSS